MQYQLHHKVKAFYLGLCFVLKIKTNRVFNYNWGDDVRPKTKVLNRLAEEYPYPKSITKNSATLPDVAWELTHFVEEITDKLIQQNANIIVALQPIYESLHCLVKGF